MCGSWGGSLWAEPVALSTPSGLNAGDRFRFLFVTAGTTTATSSAIGDYNTFVQTQAGGATSNGSIVTWKAIGSTATVDARDNVGGFGTTVGVYLPGGTLLASSLTTNSGGLWSAALFSAPNQLINGTVSTGTTWTGSNPSGVATSLPLGATAGSSSWADRSRSDNGWILINPFSSTNSYGMYGLSDELTASSPVVPEIDPAGMGSVLALVTGVLSLVERRRHARVGARDC
ncbi:MAG: hypothetical protein FJ309_09200 [Planctomycetes bacterium]|nr:hypothetical protein [Planctomycetota bacterium]